MENSFSQVILKHPFACLVSGPTKSGKSYLVRKILQQNRILIDKPIDKIIYCYSSWQTSFEDNDFKTIFPIIELYQGIPSVETFDVNKNNIIILDDLMKESGSENSIYDLFCVDSHHKSISVFLMTQNLFPREKNARAISLNCDYIIIMNNPRDKNQVNYLARQIFPKKSKYLIEAYEDATENKEFGHLFLDLTQTTAAKFRVQSNILGGDKRVIYLPISI